MSPMRKDPLLTLVQSYFVGHLRSVRGTSEHTQRAYRDGLRLFFVFVAEKLRRPISNLQLDDITVENVLAFLDYVETKRGSTTSTRNCRLTAIRGFVQHLLRHDVSRAAQYQRILSIPLKKARVRPVIYLEPEEMKKILAQPDQRTPLGVRDRALLLFMYNTGARVAEALAVRPKDIQLRQPRLVRLYGKGSKERICPLWAETTAALQPVLKRVDEDDRIFCNGQGGAMTRDGVAYIIRKYVESAARSMPALRKRNVTPHSLRHSCAFALLQAGVDITVIRDYLGHSSIATTSRYITTNLQMRRDALQQFWRRSGLSRTAPKEWRPTPGLLTFLESL